MTEIGDDDVGLETGHLQNPHVTDYKQSQFSEFSEFSVFFVCPAHGVTEALRHHFVEDPKALKAAGVHRSHPITTHHEPPRSHRSKHFGHGGHLETQDFSSEFIVLMSQGEK